MQLKCNCHLCVYFANGGDIPSGKAQRKRFNRWLQQGGTCFYCSVLIASWRDGVLEHIVPKSQGGREVVCACKQCDTIKGSLSSPSEFDAQIERLENIKQKIISYGTTD